MKDALQTTEYGKVVACDLPIDVQKALAEKLGKDFRPYRILGACNPVLAHEALSTDAQLGLLLPCNVVVQEESGHAIVSASVRAFVIGQRRDVLPVKDIR